MKMLKKVCIFIFAFIMLFTAETFAAVNYPEPTNYKYINDYANVISADTKNKIVQVGDELYKKTGAEVVAAVMEKTGDETIEDYSTGLFRKWGIGQKDKNNGVLILLAFKNSNYQRKSRIEVGYGLEGALTDAGTGSIQDEYMLPYYKNGDYSTGILNGYMAVCKTVAREYNVTLDSVNNMPEPIVSDDNQNYSSININPLYIILFIFALFAFDGFFLKWTIFRILMAIIFGRGGRGGFGGFGGSSGGGGFGGFGGGSSGGGGSSRNW
jgi:uncharacterized protein